MKKACKILSVIISLIIAVSGVPAADKKIKSEIKTIENYIAVFDFEVTTGDQGISRPLSDKVIHELSTSDKYEVIDRGNMNKILKEQKFQMSGCVAQECKVEAGQILGVGKIVSGSVGIVGKTYYLTLLLIDVKTGKVELSAEDECRCEIDELLGSTKRLARKLLGEQVAQPPGKAEQTAKSKADAEVKARIESEARARAEAEAKVKAEFEARARAEEVERIRAEQVAIAKAKADAEAKAKAEAELKARHEADARARAEAEARLRAEQLAAVKAKAEAEAKAKAEAELKARQEAETRVKAEQLAVAKAKADAEAKVRAEAEAKARAEAELKASQEIEARARAEAEAKAKAVEAERTKALQIAKVIDTAAGGTKTVSSGGHFEKLASGVVRDNKSGLEWYAGPDKSTSQVEAKAWAEVLKIDGGGWRMPKTSELKTLFHKGAGPRNMTPLIETDGWLIWSGETGVSPGGGDFKAWAVDFSDGREVLERRADSNYMRGFAVRSTDKSSTPATDTSVVRKKTIASDGRFEKLSTGVVWDTKSGLEWYAGPDKNTNHSEATRWAADLKVDGGGWRMPAISELKGLFQKGAGPRNITSLIETTGWLIWSVEAGVGPGGMVEGNRLVLDLDTGRELTERRDNPNYKRGFAVRSRTKESSPVDPGVAGAGAVASDGRFEKLNNGIVRDIKSNLEWYTGPDKNIGWDDAKQWVFKLEVDDGGGWRMPTIAELRSLFRKGAGPRNMTPLLQTTGWWVWSGETAGLGMVAGNSGLAFDFDNGTESLDRRDNSNYKRVFAVRSRK